MDPDERHHEDCRLIIEAESQPAVVSPFVLAELDYLIQRKLGVVAELAMLEDVAAGAYQLAEMSAGDVAACHAIAARYQDLGLGIADASVIHLANRHNISAILTLDERHFRAVRDKDGRTFRLLPADH